jgi:hypothetical protein
MKGTKDCYTAVALKAGVLAPARTPAFKQSKAKFNDRGNSMIYSEQTRIRDLLNDPRAVAVLERHLPGATTHPQLHEALDMTLREVSYYPESGLTPAKLQALVQDLAQL